MNFNKEDEFNVTESIHNIERRFCKFYTAVVEDRFCLDKNLNPIRVKRPYHCKKTWKVNNKLITYSPNELLLLCIEDTCLGLRKFYSSLKKYIEITKYLSKINPIRIYCKQGESLLSALGICIVIDEAIENFSDEMDVKQIQLTVSEKQTNWRIFCIFIMEKVSSCFKNIEVKLQLVGGRSTYLSVDDFRAMKEADIVVMARYLSKLHHMKAEVPETTYRFHVLEVVLKRMKELSILFYLDTYNEAHQETLKQLFSKLDSLIEIRSKKSVFAPPESSKKYLLEFPFMFTSTFNEVMYSTCVKYSGLSYNCSDKKHLKFAMPFTNYSRREKKLKISEVFEKENSHFSSMKCVPGVNISHSKTFITAREHSLSNSNGKARKTESSRNKLMAVSKVSDHARIYLAMPAVLIPNENSKKKASKYSKNADASSLPTPVRNKVNSNSESREDYKTSATIFKRSRMVEKFTSANAHNQNKAANINTSNGGIDQSKSVFAKVPNTSAPNYNKHSKVNRRKLGAKSRKIAGKSKSRNLRCENEYKCPYLRTKESISSYAFYLAEIYYSKNFDRQKQRIRKYKAKKH